MSANTTIKPNTPGLHMRSVKANYYYKLDIANYFPSFMVSWLHMSVSGCLVGLMRNIGLHRQIHCLNVL